ncbi:MAG: MGDG synthase family glycosyltransferase [Anaerolineae bacterium]
MMVRSWSSREIGSKRRPRRFLFLFSDTGGGHRASAQAVLQELDRLYGDAAAVEMVDVFVEMERWPFYRFPEWYRVLVGLRGIPWAVGFHLSDGIKLMKTMSRLVWPYAGSAMCDVLRRYPADVIVSLHPLPNYALTLALRQMGCSAPLAIVAVDLVTVHAGWLAPGAQLYLMASEAAKARALERGLPKDRVHAVGMPTRRAFVTAMHITRREARERLALPLDRPVVLMVGGGEGMGPLSQVVKALARRRPDAHLVAIAGRNEALRRELRELELPVAIQVEGFVSNMEIWMRAADILVTKAGPNTLCEAFLAGLPLVLYTALPGQEEGNVSHVVENGAGIWAPLPRLAAKAVMHLLANRSLREAMAMRSRQLARPQATEIIARHLWGLAGPHRRPSIDRVDAGAYALPPYYYGR